MKAVLHGRTDEAILRNYRDAMSAHAKLLIIERLLPEHIDPNDALARENFLSDIDMMVAAGGCERTETEYRALLVKAAPTPHPRHPHARDIGHRRSGVRLKRRAAIFSDDDKELPL